MLHNEGDDVGEGGDVNVGNVYEVSYVVCGRTFKLHFPVDCLLQGVSDSFSIFTCLKMQKNKKNKTWLQQNNDV